ncbi:MAG: hypothetical protein J0H27_13900 [Xanthomonadales bacterium]|nr:hypothetical protein [Xanthomonadales bacterium]ODU92911.1 MAG: hypothetical protein ABT18_10490 [Rhodanobacter sp. SCN 66-43]OJY83701.1 MAG: hypothetical protein BGP23_13715 [Xanthomonadales bacterium 66-474]
MKIAIIASRVLLGVSGVALLLLGILFWTGHALTLVPLHMLLGALLVLSMWMLVAISLHARTAMGFAAVVLAWSLIVPLLGMTQMQLLPGSGHWMIQVLHLLVGIAAMGLGGVLAKRLTAQQARDVMA